MCLAIHVRVESLQAEGDGLLMGRVSFGGIVREICLACVPEVKVGDYVLAHVGMAIGIVDEEEARRVFAWLDGEDVPDEVSG